MTPITNNSEFKSLVDSFFKYGIILTFKNGVKLNKEEKVDYPFFKCKKIDDITGELVFNTIEELELFLKGIVLGATIGINKSTFNKI